MINEYYANIKGYEDLYQISNYEQLQSNWNSLREELKKHKDILNARWQQFASHKNQNKDILNRFESKIEEIDFILDKMTELEGNDK